MADEQLDYGDEEFGGVSQMQGNQMGANANVNMARPIINENQARPPADNGATTLFVGELHYWTTEAELENVLSQYGRVKEIKFLDERASGKSKGYCQVDFYESGSAAACKDGMNGYVFNGRPCVVAFASPPEPQGRRPMHDGAGRGGGTKFSGGDAGRNFGRGNWGGRGQQRGVNRGGAHMRGTGGMGLKNANTPGFGGPAGGAYGQGLGGGPASGGPPGGFMHPQGMMGGGFDPTYMGRGAGYGGFPGSGFPGMMPQFPGVNPMGIAWPPADNGATTLFVGELQYWTTEAELENVLSQYGRVKEIKFFVERASGKSKGYCQVDFYESGSAAACKDGMNGYVFNGRPCVVTSDCKVEDSTIMLEIKIKMLERKIKMMEASLELKRNSEDQACQSVAMLHKLLYDMENLRM